MSLSILLQSTTAISLQPPVDTSSSSDTTTLSPPLYRFLFIAIGLMAFFWLIKTIIRIRAMIELWTALKRQQVIRVDGLRHIGQLSRDNLQQIMRSRSSHVPSHVPKLTCHGYISTESIKLQAKETDQAKQEQSQTPQPPLSPSQCTLTFQISTSSSARIDVYVGVAHSTINQLYSTIEKNKKKLSKPLKKKRSTMKGKNGKKSINIDVSQDKALSLPTSPSPITPIPRTSLDITSTDVAVPTVHDDQHVDVGIGLGLDGPRVTTSSGPPTSTTSQIPLDTVPHSSSLSTPPVSSLTPTSPPKEIELVETRVITNEPLFKSSEYIYKANSLIVDIGIKKDIEISIPRSIFNKLDTNIHPIIIHVVPLENNPSLHTNTDDMKQQPIVPHAVSQITLAQAPKTVSPPSGDDLNHIKFEKQLILSSTHIMETLDLFGLEDDSNECIVCLTDPKEIILLPCRHVALCSTCHENVTKCPVCRAGITNYMKFVPEAEAVKIVD